MRIFRISLFLSLAIATPAFCSAVSQLDSLIIEAMQSGNLPAIVDCIEQGIDINAEIGEEELGFWEDFVGEIDHLITEELLVENLYESSRLIPPFSQIRDTIAKIFKYLHARLLC